MKTHTTKHSSVNRVIKTPDATHWMCRGKLHRKDGPATVWSNGGEEWWLNGMPHRDDGPSSHLACGAQFWHRHGKLHRLDGPAAMASCGKWHFHGLCISDQVGGPFQWWVNGKQFTEDEFYRYVDTATGEIFIPPGKILTYRRRTPCTPG